MRTFLLSICIAIVLSACSESLDDLTIQSVETINGFELNWRSTVSDEQKTVIREIVDNMIFVKGGTFIMGATAEQVDYARVNEYPQCYVRLSDYYISRYEITEEQYEAIVGDSKTYNTTYSGYVIFDDWQYFLETLTEISGLEFSLPTEAQWEYAARGGSQSNGYVYPGSDNLSDVWTDSSTEGSTTPNELGIYNMADLLSEWCIDFYDEYDGSFYEDPCVVEGEYHVVRGGNYYCYGTDSDYTEEKTNSTYNSFGHYRDGGSTSGAYDYRYCRTTARSYQQISYIMATNGSTRYYIAQQYIGCRPVINITQ